MCNFGSVTANEQNVMHVCVKHNRKYYDVVCNTEKF